MAFTYTAPFAQTPMDLAVDLTLAVAVGTTGSALITAGSNGAIVTSVRAIPKGTVTATGINLNRSGKPIRSASIAAYTYSATAKLPEGAVFDVSETAPIRLAANEVLDVSLLVAQAAGVTVFAEWTNF